MASTFGGTGRSEEQQQSSSTNQPKVQEHLYDTPILEVEVPPRMAESSQELELENIKQSLDSMKVCSNISKTQMKGNKSYLQNSQI